MKTVMVRYKTKDDAAEQNAKLIHAVFDELRAKMPTGLRYATFKLADGVSFVHLATIDTPDGVSPLDFISAFKLFAQGVKDRCVEPPVLTELLALDAYGVIP